MRPLLASALTLGLLLAGCSEPAAPEADPQAQPTTSGTQTSTAATAPPAEPVVETVPFTWTGHTKEGAWVCMEQDGSGQCPAGSQVAPDGQHVFALSYEGNVTALEATMTWQADPTQTGLVLAVYGNKTGGRTPLAMAQGDSPLSLSLDLAGAGLVADNALVLMVWPEGKTPTSPSVFVDATQVQFTVEGALERLA